MIVEFGREYFERILRELLNLEKKIPKRIFNRIVELGKDLNKPISNDAEI